MEIGRRVKKIREQLGLSQREGAAAAGMPSQYLCDLERGRIENPSLSTLKRLAQAYGIGVDQLIGQSLTDEVEDLPQGLQELLRDPDWSKKITPSWTETLLRIHHLGRSLQTKEEFLEAYLALRRIFADSQ